jgi:sugar phosphate isomerase/epimerase
MKLAIENHFDIPCRVLAEVAGAYPPARVGFCIDTANSLRNFEPPERVFDLLDTRAVFFHLKDYRVRGTNVGFSVDGAPLGTGDLDLSSALHRIFAATEDPQVFIENWVPASGDHEADVEADRRWLEESLANLVRRLPYATKLPPAS